MTVGQGALRGPLASRLTVWHREGLEIQMSEYQGSRRAPGRQAARWLPLVIYGVGLAFIAAELSGWWNG